MKRLVWVMLITMFVSCRSGNSQVINLIKNDENSGGVYRVPCKVNGIPMNFIFDTGCYDVTISAVEAGFLLKHGLLEKGDILERTAYMGAGGRIDTSTTIIIRKLEIDGILLENIVGSVSDNGNAPLLLGQTALQKLGPIMVDFENKRIVVLNKQ